ncbi:MCE family protein [Thermoleophilia bacterium SCSIO 60948]|nr:MCE family protein [Thermoleophilia bacterium SCSIO 60948]
MRRALLISAGLIAAICLFVVAQGSRDAEVGDGEGYYVRAIFDNGGFVVPDEEVRVAGAKVGVISDVGITNETEAVHADGSPDPGKAVVVLRIEDEAFQDFRQDATCIIRPQSFIGEKFVECDPTRPRAAGVEPPPPLERIGEGEPGEGQYLLPIEQNGKAVDLDLVNNIMRESYADRFRLILNDLGAGFATRGDELNETIRRTSPALRQTNEVLAILAEQNQTLSQLAEDSDASLEPLAAERERLTGFIRNAQQSAAAAAERRDDIEAGLVELPPALDEVTLTMRRLENFSDQARPTLADFAAAAPSLVRTSQALGPFSRAATPALRSLGEASERTTEPLNNADPVIRDIRNLATATQRPAGDLKSLLGSLNRQDAYPNLLEFIYNGAGSANGYDDFGHYFRAVLVITNCLEYQPRPFTGCEGGRFDLAQSTASAPASIKTLGVEDAATALGGLGDGSEIEAPDGPAAELEPEPETETPPMPQDPDDDGTVDEPEGEPEAGSEDGTEAEQVEAGGATTASAREADLLMDYLMGGS